MLRPDAGHPHRHGPVARAVAVDVADRQLHLVGDPAGEARVLRVLGVDGIQRLVQRDHPVGVDAAQEAEHRTRLGLGSGPGARFVVTVEIPPARGKVAVQVDAAGVLAAAPTKTVRVHHRDNPQVDPGDRLMVTQVQQRAGGLLLVAVHGADGHHCPPVGPIPQAVRADRSILHGAADDPLRDDGPLRTVEDPGRASRRRCARRLDARSAGHRHVQACCEDCEDCEDDGNDAPRDASLHRCPFDDVQSVSGHSLSVARVLGQWCGPQLGRTARQCWPARRRTQQPARWSFTMPLACIRA